MQFTHILLSSLTRLLDLWFRKSKTEAPSNHSNKNADNASSQSPDSNGALHSDKDSNASGQPETDDEEYLESAGDADCVEKDADYNDTHNDSDIANNSEKEKGIHKQKDIKTNMTIGLRRSGRTSGNTINNDTNDVVAMGHAAMKKRLRQRPTRNAGYTVQNLSDTDAGSNSESE